MADPDLVRDPDEEQPPPPRRRVPFFNPPVRPVATRERPPEAPDLPGDTLPMIGAAPPPRPAPQLLSDVNAERMRTLEGQIHPQRAPTFLGRLGHTLNVIGQDVGTALEPELMANIPGTFASKRAELAELHREQGPQLAREAAAKEAEARTGIEQQRVGLEARRAGLPEMFPPGDETVRTVNGVRQNLWRIPGQPTQWVNEGEYPKVGATAEPLPGAAVPGATLSGTRALPAPPPPPTPGTLPRTQDLQAPPMAAPAAPTIRYGKQSPPMTEEERLQANAEFADIFRRSKDPTAKLENYQLPPGATKEDHDRMEKQLTHLETASGLEAQRQANENFKQATQAREAELAQIRKDEAAGKMVVATEVDRPDKRHYMSRGDYQAHANEYRPNPITLPPGSYEQALKDIGTMNEMQGRMNGMADAIQTFHFEDAGQQRLVMQAMNDVEKNYVDQVIGIPIMNFVAQNIKKWGLQGATPETRKYIVNLLSLREAMLGQPKEITGGSRMFEGAIHALYATLPAGVTPDRSYAMLQMRTAQSVLDRLAGTRVPIVEGVRIEHKIPELYMHVKRNPQGAEIYSDDGKTWVDENGNAVGRR